MNLIPVPPPEPPTAYSKHSDRSHTSNNLRTPSPDARTVRPTTAGLLRFPTPAHILTRQQQDSETNNSQHQVNLFKHELMFKQNQLSSLSNRKDRHGLTIDEKIELRRKQEKQQQSANNPCIPDKLMGTNSMQQKDKRPFAYSPDVNDPNNRGKLDLSQIKSPIMRRRLLANMESKSGEDDDDEQDDCAREGLITNKQQVTLAPSHSCKPAVAPKPTHLKLGAMSDMKHEQQQRHAPVVVRFDEPPSFYNTTHREPSDIATAHQLPSNHASLDAEIAQSLDKLDLLANQLDQQYREFKSPKDTRRAETSTVSCGNAREYRLSTFQPTSSNNYCTPYEINQYQRRTRPNFYDTLPSGRATTYDYANNYSPLSLYTKSDAPAKSSLPLQSDLYSYRQPTVNNSISGGGKSLATTQLLRSDFTHTPPDLLDQSCQNKQSDWQHSKTGLTSNRAFSSHTHAIQRYDASMPSSQSKVPHHQQPTISQLLGHNAAQLRDITLRSRHQVERPNHIGCCRL